MNKTDNCNFDPFKILKKGEKLESKERKKYYEEIITEAYVKHGARNIDAYRKGLTLKEILENEIKKIDDEQKDGNVNKNLKVKNLTGNENLIWWKGTEAQLEFLFALLINANLIDSSQYNERFALIAKHFKNPNGKTYNNKQSSQAVRNLRGKKPPNSDKLIEIITNVNSKK